MQTPQSSLRPGDVFVGKYRIDRELGRGGMGYVLAATHVHTHEPVALKFLLPEVAAVPEAVERFLREARAASRIKSEHVARVRDVDLGPTGTPYMVMEFLEGQDLGRLLERHHLPIDAIVDYVLQACEALAEAHVQGIVHRDLKPSNLFLTHRRDGAPLVKVLDFGISRLGPSEGPGLTRTSALLGSPLYMSPEQILSPRDVDARSDLWSLGVTLFEMIARTPPFEHENHYGLIALITTKDAPSLRARRPGCPEGLDTIVRRCLTRDRDRRFASVAELAQALEPFAPSTSRLSIERISLVAMPSALKPTSPVEATLVDRESMPPGRPSTPDRGSLTPPRQRPSLPTLDDTRLGDEDTRLGDDHSTLPPWSQGKTGGAAPPPSPSPAPPRRGLLVGALVVVASVLGLGLLFSFGREPATTASPLVAPPPAASPAVSTSASALPTVTPVTVSLESLPRITASAANPPASSAPRTSASGHGGHRVSPDRSSGPVTPGTTRNTPPPPPIPTPRPLGTILE